MQNLAENLASGGLWFGHDGLKFEVTTLNIMWSATACISASHSRDENVCLLRPVYVCVCLYVDGSNCSTRDRLVDNAERIERRLGANTLAYQLWRRRQYQRRGATLALPRVVVLSALLPPHGTDSQTCRRSDALLFVIYDDNQVSDKLLLYATYG